MSCKLFVYFSLTVVSIALISFASYLPVRFNLTGSMPRGIYLLKSSHIINRGDLIMICLPNFLANFGLQRGYLLPGSCQNGSQPLLKKVVAKSGDTIVLSADSMQVNGKQLPCSATLNTDYQNRTLPSTLRGIYTLKQHQLWLYGVSSARSWDSRYMGVIDSSSVINVVMPLITYERGHNS
jgi:conjugative transfer signal peptidase TraF